MEKYWNISNDSGEGFIINIGPQHPSTHGVLRLATKVNGETVEAMEPYLGYIHRGIEKISESLTYKQIGYLTSRMDYLSAHMNNQAVALCIEQGASIQIPQRAKVIRTIMAELQRLASHLLWWGCMGLDMGAVSPFFYAFREREMILEIFEETGGNRLTMNYIVPGGVMHDLHKDFVKKVNVVLASLHSHTNEYEELLGGNVIFKHRLGGVGVLSSQLACELGCTGPVARASGISCDIRKHRPYDAYDRVKFNEITDTVGDCMARYRVRIAEIKESISIIEQLINNIPDGDYRTPIKGQLKLPTGEYYQRVETARGELGVYIVSNGGATPYRVKYRTPNFGNLLALKPLVLGAKIGDLVAIMSTLDLIIPDIDR
ncbi:MAG: NADH-quinone oxidoreductase subunit C [Bacteroidales bacterium]